MKQSEIFLLLANEIRFCILSNLYLNGEKNVTELQACSNASQSNVSQQLSKLKSVGVIECKKTGNEVFYKIVDPKMKKIIKYTLEELND